MDAREVRSFTDFLSRQPDVVAAYLFGSQARGTARARSDVDVAVLFAARLDEQTTLERQLAILVALTDLTSREVQVTVLNRASPFFTFQVLKDGRRLYERDKAERVEFEVRAYKTYFDFQPILEYQNKMLLKRIKETGLGRKKRRPSRALEVIERIQERPARTEGD